MIGIPVQESQSVSGFQSIRIRTLQYLMTRFCSSSFIATIPLTLRPSLPYRSFRWCETPKMVKTASKKLSSETVAPDFALVEPLTGNTVTRNDVRGEKGLLVVFMCNHCPFVISIQSGLADAGKKAKELGIGMVGISSNDVDNYPADSPEKMKDLAGSVFSTFKYLYDPTQKAALDYKAVCTPDIFLFDGNLKLFYHGQFDDSRPGNRKRTSGKSLIDAMEKLAAGGEPVTNAKPSIGCSIKWKPENDPYA